MAMQWTVQLWQIHIDSLCFGRIASCFTACGRWDGMGVLDGRLRLLLVFIFVIVEVTQGFFSALFIAGRTSRNSVISKIKIGKTLRSYVCALTSWFFCSS